MCPHYQSVKRHLELQTLCLATFFTADGVLRVLNRTRDERFLARSDLIHIWLDTVRRQTGCYKSNVCVSRMISRIRRRPSVGLIFDRALDVAAGKLVPRSRRSRPVCTETVARCNNVIRAVVVAVGSSDDGRGSAGLDAKLVVL